MYINENEHFIRASFKIIKEWFDSKLTFQNLKKDSRNLINPTERDAVWIPWIWDLKIETEEKCTRGTDKEVFEVHSNDDYMFQYNSITQHQNAYLFEV